MLDPIFLSQLKQVELALRPSRASHKVGFHQMNQQGRSLEFTEYREYRPGDDLKDLDWKLFARSDRYYLKQRDSHHPASTLILVDVSDSMLLQSGQAEVSKRRAALLLAFGIATVLHRQGDLFHLHAFPSETHPEPPRSSKRAFHYLFEKITEIDACKAYSAEQEHSSSRFALDSLKPRSLDHLFFISDFMEPEPVWKQWLKSLNYSAKNISCFHILDPQEVNPSSETLLIHNLEQQSQKRFMTAQDWMNYERNFVAHCAKLSHYLKQNNMPYLPLLNTSPLYAGIRKVLTSPSLLL